VEAEEGTVGSGLNVGHEALVVEAALAVVVAISL